MSAVKRAIMEMEFMEAYHWLPQDIKKIPYKDLQEYSIIRRQKNEIEHEDRALQQQIQNSKSRGVSSGRGQSKRYK